MASVELEMSEAELNQLQDILTKVNQLEEENEEMVKLLEKFLRWFDTKADNSQIASMQRQMQVLQTRVSQLEQQVSTNQGHGNRIDRLNRIAFITSDRLSLASRKNIAAMGSLCSV